MTIKSSLLGEIFEKLLSLRMNITIRLDDDREEGDLIGSAFELRSSLLTYEYEENIDKLRSILVV